MRGQRRAPQANLAYRTVPEAQILEILMLGGFAFDIEQGRASQAERLTKDALSTLVDQGLGYRLDANGVRCFDPVEVVNTMKWLGLSADDTFWRDHYVTTGRNLVLEWERVSNPAAPALALRLKRAFGAQHFDGAGRRRLRLPLPLDDDAQTQRALAVDGLQKGGYRKDVSPGRFEVRLEGGAPGPVSLSADIKFTPIAPAETAALNDADLALYTHKSEGFIQVTPTIQTLADRLSGDAGDPTAAVHAFWTYLIDEMACGSVRYGEFVHRLAVEACLQTRWYDCQLGAALLASLCRAKGIPARLVGGYVPYRLAPTNHYWVEVWLAPSGWRVYDFLSWDLSNGGSDVEWRSHFAGRSDLRIVTERYPHLFTGLGSVRFPAQWQMVQYSSKGGVKVDYSDLSGVKIYSDFISISYA